MTMLLDEIRDNWKLDAKTENSDRYFYHVKEVQRIVDGKRSYVIGRKGTGKTAISEHIAGLVDPFIFSEKLSFKHFPFNELYELKNLGYTAPNQYITLWKYIIYSCICRMMAKNEAISNEIQPALKKMYAPEPIDSLHRWIKKWTANDFSLMILGTGGKVSYKESEFKDSWVNRVDVLESIIAEYADDSKYYIIFDELDEDYKNITDKQQHDNYTHLLTGLFKAVQDIKSVFKTNRTKIFPVIFLRDDIYSVITDPDKTKWDDFKIELEWDAKKLQDLLAFRISRAINPDGPKLSFDSAWRSLFVNGPIHYGHRQMKEISVFDFIAGNTHLRPRDFIRYIRECAENSSAGTERISTGVVKKMEKSFSSYLKRELVDEIHGVVPDITSVLEIISQIRKETFSEKDFVEIFKAKRLEGSIKEGDSTFILKILFIFSVIGNQPKQINQVVFRYRNRDAELNIQENFIVHRGLLKALQIL
jgi:hypothetical protein